MNKPSLGDIAHVSSDISFCLSSKLCVFFFFLVVCGWVAHNNNVIRQYLIEELCLLSLGTPMAIFIFFYFPLMGYD